MTNEQVYGDRSHESRASTQYQPGDRVAVGPAYQMGGSYRVDGTEGEYYFVQSRVPNGNDYKLSLCRGGPWELIAHASRLTLKGSA